MAVIGSGPAGFYTAYRVMAKVPARVDMYESLPVPFGLVRFGVAPDHPEVKNCQEKFEEVAASPDFRFMGNVAVGAPLAVTTTTATQNAHGGSVPLETLARHYDAVVFAYGASRDRTLGLPGENLRGVYAARDFVGWYNGLPDCHDAHAQKGPQQQQVALADHIAADLARAETAVIIGQGNVALDVARMLLEDVDVLRKTDISKAAIEALAASRVRRVHVVGRRGPMQAAFTIKELRELMQMRSVGLQYPVDAALLPPDFKALPRPQRRLMEVVAKGSTTPLAEARSMWSLDFCLAPKRFSAAFEGGSDGGASDIDDNQPHVATATFDRTHLAAPFDRNTHCEPTGELVHVPADLVFRSIGYRAEALAGFDALDIPFDQRRGVIRNDGVGRVLREVRTPDAAMTSEPNPGFYCAGWVKRGPTGVIAATMDDAFSTADAIVSDWQAQAPFLGAGSAEEKGGWDGVRSETDMSAARVVSWEDWQRIDKAEMDSGRQDGKPRNKITRRADMLAVLQ
ncbi:NADPH-adrenodoxin reductase [Niveomyces insectorum RCEF 264]|uniref:NADPH:adrenodoxin oxidoreductase, mitochondrial n=1 Tax=Niveomyces insectorum RCEF 264 TaxID=1081102 RepID=A0A168ABQ0_9HYPO|nr:NADPH-adrenodoxin reductase [Niveomyces insectorum RCEF 264]